MKFFRQDPNVENELISVLSLFDKFLLVFNVAFNFSCFKKHNSYVLLMNEGYVYENEGYVNEIVHKLLQVYYRKWTKQNMVSKTNNERKDMVMSVDVLFIYGALYIIIQIFYITHSLKMKHSSMLIKSLHLRTFVVRHSKMSQVYHISLKLDPYKSFHKFFSSSNVFLWSSVF